MLPCDKTGTPFVFAAWVTALDGEEIRARVMDCMTFDDPDANDRTTEYGMEADSVLLSGATRSFLGAVLLADRANIGSVGGRETFVLGGADWVLGYAATEDEALALVAAATQPGCWPDPRGGIEPADAYETEHSAYVG